MSRTERRWWGRGAWDAWQTEQWPGDIRFPECTHKPGRTYPPEQRRRDRARARQAGRREIAAQLD